MLAWTVVSIVSLFIVFDELLQAVKGDSFCAFLVVERNDQVIVEQIDRIDKAIDQTAAVVKLFHIEFAVLGEIENDIFLCNRWL